MLNRRGDLYGEREDENMKFSVYSEIQTWPGKSQQQIYAEVLHGGDVGREGIEAVLTGHHVMALGLERWDELAEA